MTPSTDLTARADTLRRLHDEHRPIVLPTVWDVWSAKTVVALGFPALTIGSHPLADSRGEKDQEGQKLEDVVAASKRITAAVDVPVSIDLESGYGVGPEELVSALLEAGGVGLNVEDSVHSDGGRLRSTEEHAQYIGGVRQAADAAGVRVWVNGRTDLFAKAGDDQASVLDEAIDRMRALVEAGADSVYPVKIQDNDDLLRAVVQGVDAPVNSTAHPVKHPLKRFADLGVRRVTTGPLFQASLTEAANDILGKWKAGS